MSLTSNLSKTYPLLMGLGNADATIYVNDHEVAVQVHGSGLSDYERVLRWRGVLDVLSQPWQFSCQRYTEERAPGGNIAGYITLHEVRVRVWVAFDDLDGIRDHLPFSTPGLYWTAVAS
jgi:hypothetical protein